MTGPEDRHELSTGTQWLLVGVVCVLLFAASWAVTTLAG